MNYLSLSIIERTKLRNILRRWKVKYTYKKSKIKCEDGSLRNIKVADIKASHLDKCIAIIENSSNKRENGTCKLIQNKETIKILKRIKNG